MSKISRYQNSIGKHIIFTLFWEMVKSFVIDSFNFCSLQNSEWVSLLFEVNPSSACWTSSLNFETINSRLSWKENVIFLYLNRNMFINHFENKFYFFKSAKALPMARCFFSFSANSVLSFSTSVDITADGALSWASYINKVKVVTLENCMKFNLTLYLIDLSICISIP